MMRVFPVLYKNKDYLITKNGKIFDFYRKSDITNKFSIEERAKIVAACWIGDINLPILYKDGNKFNIERRNIYYEIDRVETIDDQKINIRNVIFYKIPDYPDYYISESAIIYSKFYKRLLHRKIAKNNYIRISLVKNGVRKMQAIHRLVFSALTLKTLKEIPDINHRDGCPWNNNYSNLEESNKTDNVRYSMFVINTRPYTWSAEDIDNICYQIANGKSIKEVYESNEWVKSRISYKGFLALVTHLIHGTKMWKDVSSRYDFSNWVASNIKYSDDDVRKICEYLEQGKRPKEIESITGIPLKYISGIKNRVSRRKISDKYKF